MISRMPPAQKNVREEPTVSMCPRSCGPVVYKSPYERDCRVCGFHDESTTPYEHGLLFKIEGKKVVASFSSGRLAYNLDFENLQLAKEYIVGMTGREDVTQSPNVTAKSEVLRPNAQILMDLPLFRQLLQIPDDWDLIDARINWVLGAARLLVRTSKGGDPRRLTVMKGKFIPHPTSGNPTDTICVGWEPTRI